MKLSLKSILPPLDLGWNRVRYVCGLADCHNKLLMRSVPGARTGIRVGERWYCSPDCFAMDSRNTLSTLASGCVVEMPRAPRLTIGLALLSKGYVNEDQLRFAAERCKLGKESLEAVLIEHEFVTERQLAAGRAAQWGYPVLGQDPIDQVMEADIPPTLLREFSAVPLHYSVKSKRLVLGFVHRVEHGLLQSIEQITGCRVEPCFITQTEFNVQMARLRNVAGYEEVVIEEPGNAPQMARTLGGFAVEFLASEASIAKCKAWVWARITGKKGTVDVVFAVKNAPTAQRTKFSSVMPEATPALG